MAKRLALITGGMGGLGATITSKMVEAGYEVVVTFSPQNLQSDAWIADMKARGWSVRAFPVDVADYDSCARCVAQVTAEAGPIDILVNNAGITRDHTFKKMTKEDWDSVIHTNLDSVFNMTKQVSDSMTERGWGRIVNVSSVNGQKGAFGQTNYSAAKAGMHGFTKALARELATKGVTVNTISPGYIGTKMVDRHSQGDSRDENSSRDSASETGKAGRSCGADYLPVLGRSRLHHRSQHLNQRRAAHAIRGCRPSPRTRREPAVDMRPGVFPRLVAGHDPDVAAANAQQLLVGARDLRMIDSDWHGGVMWSAEAITFSRFALIRPGVDALAADHELALHQPVLPVQIVDQLPERAARDRDEVGDPGVHRVPGLDRSRIVDVVEQLQEAGHVVLDRLQGLRAVVDHLPGHIAEGRKDLSRSKYRWSVHLAKVSDSLSLKSSGAVSRTRFRSPSSGLSAA